MSIRCIIILERHLTREKEKTLPFLFCRYFQSLGPTFAKNGIHTVSDFKTLEKDTLTRFGITDPTCQSKLLTAVGVLVAVQKVNTSLKLIERPITRDSGIDLDKQEDFSITEEVEDMFPSKLVDLPQGEDKNEPVISRSQLAAKAVAQYCSKKEQICVEQENNEDEKEESLVNADYRSRFLSARSVFEKGGEKTVRGVKDKYSMGEKN